MEFQSETPAIVTAIRQRDLLNTWIALYLRNEDLPSISEYEPGRLKEEADDLVYYSVETCCTPPVVTIRSEGTRMSSAYGAIGKGRHLDEYVGLKLAGLVMPVYHLCIERRRPVYTVSHLKDAEGREVEYERLLLPFGQGGAVTDIIASLKTISIEGRFELRDLMKRKDIVAAPAVRAVIDRDLSHVRIYRSASWADDLVFE